MRSCVYFKPSIIDEIEAQALAQQIFELRCLKKFETKLLFLFAVLHFSILYDKGVQEGI